MTEPTLALRPRSLPQGGLFAAGFLALVVLLRIVRERSALFFPVEMSRRWLPSRLRCNLCLFVPLRGCVVPIVVDLRH